MLIVFLHGVPEYLEFMLGAALAAVAALALAGAAIGRRILAPGAGAPLPLIAGVLGGTALAIGGSLALVRFPLFKGLSTPGSVALVAALAIAGGFLLAGVIGLVMRRP